ncbi:MAG: diguanylate cyclase [Thermaerobacter sp.]|nr:diguanylate cyclase [Thermaerobacter sp.]
MPASERVLTVFLNSSQQVIRERDLRKKLRLVAAAVTEAGLFRRAVVQLYGETYGEKIFGCAGLTAAEEAWLNSRNTWGPREYDRITAAATSWHGIYYVPHDRLEAAIPDLGETLIASARPWSGEGYWHPNDMLFATLVSSQGEVMGNLTADEPHDDRIPSRETAALLAPFLSMASAAVEQELNRRRDTLTGCFNGPFCLDETSRRLGKSQPVGFLFCDLDNLKTVNDRYGHGAGDRLILDVGSRLRTLVSSGPFAESAVCRLHGDEFAVLFQVPMDHSVHTLINWLRGQWPAILPEVSWGLAVSKSGDTPHTLMRRAELAMYNDKRGKTQRPLTNRITARSPVPRNPD